MNNLQKNNINNDGAYTRKKAIEILVKILENNKPLDNAFEESTKKSSHFSNLINEDKSFCRLLISTTLRNLISIDYLLTKFLSKPLNKTPLKVLMILRINVAQSFFLKTPDHAVVNTSVELSGKKWKGLVNGVSREILRNKDKAKKYLNESDKVPNWLLKRWKRDWSKNYKDIFKGHLNLNPPIDLYVKNNANYWARKLNGKKLGNNCVRLFTPGLITNLEG